MLNRMSPRVRIVPAIQVEKALRSVRSAFAIHLLLPALVLPAAAWNLVADVAGAQQRLTTGTVSEVPVEDAHGPVYRFENGPIATNAGRPDVTPFRSGHETPAYEQLPPLDTVAPLPSVDIDTASRSMPATAGSVWPDCTSPAKSSWLRTYEQRAATADDEAVFPGQTEAFPAIPEHFVAWWQDRVISPMQGLLRPRNVDIETLIFWTLKYSPQVRAISDSPLIRETAIVEAEADFDWTAFMESRFDDFSDPVGNTLTTGGPSRFRDHNWMYRAGARRRCWSGGEFEISQRLGYQDNNSRFFTPTQQGTSRLALSFTQPLLNGRGSAVNTNLIVQAEIHTGTAWNEFAEELQDHLLEVTETYWRLYLGRATLLQKERHLTRAAEILEQLDSRRGVDALQSQIVLARAAVATRQAELVRAGTTVQNAETKIRALVNAPELFDSGRLELVPVDAPGREYVEISVRDALLTALRHRQEIDAAIGRIQASSVRLNVSRNELLPILDFVMETYVAGLEGESNIGRALGNQFSVGEPGYSVGLQFEVPFGNRAARARHKRRQLETRQLVEQFKTTVENLEAEVEVAVREVKTAYREMHGNYQAMVARQTETDYLRERWELLPGDDRAASFLLEELLDAQDRLAIEEFAYVRAELDYMVSMTMLNRVTGTLLEHEQVSAYRTCQNGMDRVILDKPRPAEPVVAP